MRVRIGKIMHDTAAEGPGPRTAVWVQGCGIRCPGCINPELFDTRGGELIDVDTIVADALAAGVEGLTLLGGEPFDQAPEVGALARAAREAGLGVICFTGHRHEALLERGDAAELLANIDLLVDGEYQAQNPERERSLVGSSNQRFLHFTPRYEGQLPAPQRNRVQLKIAADGTVEMAGFLESDALKNWASALEATQRPHRAQRPRPAREPRSPQPPRSPLD